MDEVDGKKERYIRQMGSGCGFQNLTQVFAGLTLPKTIMEANKAPVSVWYSDFMVIQKTIPSTSMMISGSVPLQFFNIFSANGLHENVLIEDGRN